MHLTDHALAFEFDVMERAREVNLRVEYAINLGIAPGDQRNPVVEQRPLGAQLGIERAFKIRARRPLTIKLQQPRRGKGKIGADGAARQSKRKQATLTIK